MHGLLGSHSKSRRSSTTSNRSSVDEARANVDGPEDETTIVEPDQGNVLSHIISQLRPGADLSRVVLPTFILEPRSMLERITNFMAHPETLLPPPDIDDPVLRFVSVVKFYMSGWHIKPPGVKKPLNPVLGETFTCWWTLPDNTKAYYISEQTSHHPPKSSYFYAAPEHHIRVDGCLKPRSKFLGNSAASLMEGIAVLRLTNRGKNPKGESYFLTQPNMYARGILFGKMKYELGDHSVVRCPENNLSADIEFKTKGWVGGTYNAIAGIIKNDKTGEALYELSGMWTGEMIAKNLKTGKKEVLFDATHARPTVPSVRPFEEQGDRESQKLWRKTAEAVKQRNHEVATDEKTLIEDMQREEARKREEEGTQWQSTLFRRVRAGPGESEEGEADLDWILNATIDGDTPEKIVKQILAFTPILPKQEQDKILGNSSQAQAEPKHVERQQDAAPSRPTETTSSSHTSAPSAPAAIVASSPQQQDFVSQTRPSYAPAAAAAPPVTEQSTYQEPTPAQPQSTYQYPSGAGQESGDIKNLLQQTGQPSHSGTLLNFQDDLRSSLPTNTQQYGAESSNTGGYVIGGGHGFASGSSRHPIIRENTNESVDEFVDAEER